MKRKSLLILLPALMVLASCNNAPKVEPRPELGDIVEDTLAHDEIFGESKISGNLGVKKAYDGNVDVPEDSSPSPSDVPTIGIQTKTVGDKISIRFVAAIKVLDGNDDGEINGVDLSDTDVSWRRAIFKDDGTVAKVVATKESTKVYTELAAPNDVEDDGIADNILTIDEFNAAKSGRSYTHFAVYTLLDLPLAYADYYINVTVACYNARVGGMPSFSKTLATTIDQATQFSFNGTGYLGVIKGEDGFYTFNPDVDPNGNHARFLNIYIGKDESFLLINKVDDNENHENDKFEVYGYDKVHLGDSGDNTFSQLGSSQFAKAKYDLMSYHIFLSAGVGTDNYIYTNCVKRYYLIPTATWTDPEYAGDTNYRFAVYYRVNGATSWYSMLTEEEGVYYADLTFPAPGNMDLIIFCKMWGDNPTNGWEQKRHQTGDLTWQPEYNQYTIASLDSSGDDDANWDIRLL